MSFNEYYENQKNNKNNISNWLPKIKDCGIAVPKTVIIDVPIEITKCFLMDDKDEDAKQIMQWVEKEVIPKIPKDMFFLFVKNGTFSNKFDFNDCATRKSLFPLTQSIININYASLSLGAGGLSELAIREKIRFNEKYTPTIYNGMPLTDEYRVFYDFDKKKTLYVVNYWDWDYCFKAISRKFTDEIIFSDHYSTVKSNYELNKDKVLNEVSEAMQNVDMKGIWSIDILRDEQSKFWLIDMAIAEQSAYWNPKYMGGALIGKEKELKKITVNEIAEKLGVLKC